MRLTDDIANRTDAYFNRTRDIIARFGDKRVTYAVFLRRPVVSAPRVMVDWLRAVADEQGFAVELDVTHPRAVGLGRASRWYTSPGRFSDCPTAKR